jgi:hypothetical protein
VAEVQKAELLFEKGEQIAINLNDRCMSVFYPNEETLHLLRPNFYCTCPKGCKNSKLVKDFRISAPFRVGGKRYSDSI